MLVFRKCKVCKTKFRPNSQQIRKGFGKFCSLKCYGIYLKSAIKGNRNPDWKGDDVGYSGLHRWMRRNFGKANKCENPDCKFKNPKRFEWALKFGKKYSRRKSDYLMLCPSCHRKLDYTEEQKEKLRSTFFQKGHTSWNKGTKGIVKVWNKGLIGYRKGMKWIINKETNKRIYFYPFRSLSAGR